MEHLSWKRHLEFIKGSVGVFEERHFKQKIEVGVNHGLQFNKLLSFGSIISLSNNDLNPYKLPSSNY